MAAMTVEQKQAIFNTRIGKQKSCDHCGERWRFALDGTVLLEIPMKSGERKKYSMSEMCFACGSFVLDKFRPQ
jgi:hypothetical protein